MSRLSVEVRHYLEGLSFLSLPRGFQGLNSRLSVLPAKPSCWASHGFRRFAEGLQLQVLVQERFLLELFLGGKISFLRILILKNFVCIRVLTFDLSAQTCVI